MRKVAEWFFVFLFMTSFRVFQMGTIAALTAFAGKVIYKGPYLQLFLYTWSGLSGVILLMTVAKLIRKSWVSD